jgi:hypothetical protein
MDMDPAFSQVADKTPTKNKFFFFKVFLLIHQSSKMKGQKEVTK